MNLLCLAARSPRHRDPGVGDEVEEDFAKIVLKAGYPSPVRTPRGEDILAACGQLKSASVKERNKKSRYHERLQEARSSG